MAEVERKPKLLDILTLSEKRRNLFLLLRDGPKTLEEIRSSLQVTASGVLPQIRKMEKKNLICRTNKKYALTEIGSVIAESFNQFVKTLNAFEENEEFWKEHEISGIPEEFRLRIHELGDYKIFRSTPTEIFKPHDEYIKNLLKSKWIRGVSPVLHPEYPKAFLILAENGANVSLILTRNVLEGIKREHRRELETFLKYKNVKMMVCEEEIKVAFTVTDFFLSMRLFLKSGEYDFYRNIISSEKSALKWGEDLFSYYEKRSEKVESQYF
ncbi:MAG: winged helix-turn-helix domain-containing protein [Methanobacteriota archaeon]